MANIMKMMKQMADMQKNLGKVQEALAAQEMEYTAGGGVIAVIITGDGNITGIRLAPPAVTPDDVDMLEDLVLPAVRGAQDLAKETSAREMKKLTAGMNLPPGLGF